MNAWPCCCTQWGNYSDPQTPQLDSRGPLCSEKRRGKEREKKKEMREDGKGKQRKGEKAGEKIPRK